MEFTDEKLTACAELMKTVLDESNAELFFANTMSKDAEPLDEFTGQMYPLNNPEGDKVGEVFFFSSVDVQKKTHKTAYVIKGEGSLSDKAFLESNTNLPEVEKLYTRGLMIGFNMLEQGVPKNITVKDIEDFVAKNPIEV